MDQTTIKTLYIFVEIGVDSQHLAQTIRLNFPHTRAQFHENLLNSEINDANIPAGTIIGKLNHLRIDGPSDHSNTTEQQENQIDIPPRTRLALVSTIQFAAALQQLKEDLSSEYIGSELVGNSERPLLWTGAYDTTIPRSKPLSPGELLGCTAPPIGEVDALM
jgi:2-(3-amino-3-carboxypropyl)histidine synthase